MSKYTTELRYICESLAENKHTGYDGIDDVLDDCWEKIFDFDFPLFDSEYKETLCKKILMHYYTREIGEETYGLWKLRVRSTLNEIMPKYNKMYNAQTLIVNPLYNFSTTANKNGTNNKTADGTENASDVRTGKIEDTKTGTITDTKTGTVENEKDGIMNKTKDGTVTNTETGSGATVDTKKVVSGNLTDTTIDLFTDTPQGDIDNMGSGGVPIVGTDTAYLTTAQKTINTQSDDRILEDRKGFSEDYQKVNTQEFDEYDESISYEDYTSTDTYNTTDTRTFNTNDTREFQNDTTTKSKATHNVTTTQDAYIETVAGYKGASQSKLFMEYKEALIDIDMMVIDDLSDCFMLVW